MSQFPPAGWNPDPTGRHEMRYWGGTAWTKHVADRGVVGIDELSAQQPRQSRYPPTDFGYVPPNDAIVKGWRCGNESCGHSEYNDRVGKWPKNCPKCGGPVTSAFLSEPWEHDADRVEIDMHLASDDGGALSFWQGKDVQWQYEHALRAGNWIGATKVQFDFDAAARARLHDGYHDSVGGVRLGFVMKALKHHRPDDAAAELLEWYRTIDKSDFLNHSGHRADCRMLAEWSIMFLLDPSCRSQPSRNEILVLAADLVHESATSLQQTSTLDGRS